MFDPYAGAGGHQPNGFDQLAALYNSFVVTDCHVAVTCVAPSSGTAFLAVGWGPSSAAPTIAGLSCSAAGEKDNNRWWYVPPSPARPSDSTVDLGTFNIANIESKTNIMILADVNYQGGVANDPPAQPQITFALGDFVANASTAQFIVTLTYHAVWKGRRALGPS